MGKKIVITENDFKNLKDAIRNAKNAGYRNSVYVRHLESELDRAEIVPAHHIPSDVVTMNTRVILMDLTDEEEMDLTLVYPDDSTLGEGKISVLAPIGTAMIGYRVEDTFEWDTPAGKRSLKVKQILYQPEATGRYE